MATYDPKPAHGAHNWDQWLNSAVDSVDARLTTIESAGVGTVALGSATPQPLGTATAGTATSASRQDHVHAKAGTAQLSATGTPSASTYLRGDNTWATPAGGVTLEPTTAPPNASTTAAALGTATTAAHSDHTHLIPTGATSTTVAIGNHTHAGADISSGTVAAARLGTGTANSTTYLRGDNTWATPAAGVTLGSATPLVDGTAAAGVSSSASHEDHVHPPLLTVVQSTKTASYTLVLGDSGGIIEMNVAGANTLTVPPNSSVAFAVGTQVGVRQYGAGTTTLAQGAGVTIRSRGGLLSMAGQYAEGTLTKRATDEWVLSGDLA